MTSARLSELGHHLSSRDRARRLREEVLRAMGSGEGHLTVDLAEVRSISDSFADEFFGIIARHLGELEFARRVHMVNASELVASAIDRAVHARLHPGEQRSAAVPGFELAAPPRNLPRANY